MKPYYDHGISADSSRDDSFRSTPSVASGLEMEGRIWRKVSVESGEGESDREGNLEGTLDSSEDPENQSTMFKMDLGGYGYARIREWADPAVGTVTAGWIGLVRGPKRREVLERYGWVFGVVAVILSAVLVGWWIRGVGRVPEGFVERGSPQWFRSRLHHGRGGRDAR